MIMGTRLTTAKKTFALIRDGPTLFNVVVLPLKEPDSFNFGVKPT